MKTKVAILELRPDTQIPSPDTVVRGIKELDIENIVYQSDTLKRIFQRLAHRGVFINRCRMDCGSYSKEIITFYNARGASEKKFDVMNNDFGWSKLPCSFLNENTTFLLLTAIAANVYLYLIGKIAKVFTELKSESRIKRFLFRFIAVPAKWIKTGRRWVLNIYFQKPYHLVWQT